MSLALFIPSLCVLAAKFWLLITAHQSKANKSILVFLFAALGLNAIELYGFSLSNFDDQRLVWLVRAYWALGFICLGSMCFEAEALYKNRQIVKIIFVTVTAFGCLTTLASPWAIAGHKDIGYSFTAVAGPLFPLIWLPFVLMLIAMPVMLIKASKQGNLNGLRAKVLFSGLCAPIAVGAVVMYCKLFSIDLSAVFFLSLSMVIFATTLVKHDWFTRFLRGAPSIEKGEFVALALEEDIDTAISELRYQTAISAIKATKTKREAAKLLGIGTTTLYRWLEARENASENPEPDPPENRPSNESITGTLKGKPNLTVVK